MNLSKEQKHLINKMIRRCHKEAGLTLRAIIKHDRLREAQLLQHILEAYDAIDECPHCGTTEMLCGHNGQGCANDPDHQVD